MCSSGNSPRPGHTPIPWHFLPAESFNLPSSDWLFLPRRIVGHNNACYDHRLTCLCVHAFPSNRSSLKTWRVCWFNSFFLFFLSLEPNGDHHHVVLDGTASVHLLSFYNSAKYFPIRERTPRCVCARPDGRRWLVEESNHFLFQQPPSIAPSVAVGRWTRMSTPANTTRQKANKKKTEGVISCLFVCSYGHTH